MMAHKHDSTGKPAERNGLNGSAKCVPLPTGTRTDDRARLDEVMAVLPESQRMVLLAIRALRGQRDTVTLGPSDIAEKAGLCVRTVKSALTCLLRKRLIERVRPAEGRRPAAWRLRVITPEDEREAEVIQIDSSITPDQPEPEPAEDRTRPLWDDKPATVDEMCDRYLEYCLYHYRDKHGELTREIDGVRRSLTWLRQVAGHKTPDELCAEDLYAAQTAMLEYRYCGRRLTRPYINSTISRLKLMLKRFARPPYRFIHATTKADCDLIEHLQPGASTAREQRNVRPVEWKRVDRVLPFCSPQVRALVLLLWHTGARPVELCIMKPRDIDMDRSDGVWVYEVQEHKTKKFGKDRFIVFGPTEQKILRPFLKGRDPEAYVFSPAEAYTHTHLQHHLGRKTPIKWGNRPGSNMRRKRTRRVRDRYDAGSIRQAVYQAAEKAFQLDHHHLLPAGSPTGHGRRRAWQAFYASLDETNRARLDKVYESYRWRPYQLRHTAATRVRESDGLDVAQIMLGHASIRTTQIYAEASIKRLVAAKTSGNGKGE